MLHDDYSPIWKHVSYTAGLLNLFEVRAKSHEQFCAEGQSISNMFVKIDKKRKIYFEKKKYISIL